jgi:hypothetical protein
MLWLVQAYDSANTAVLCLVLVRSLLVRSVVRRAAVCVSCMCGVWCLCALFGSARVLAVHYLAEVQTGVDSL